jgi:hypothetical protein
VGLAALIAFAIWGMPALAARVAPSPSPTATATYTSTATLKPSSTSTATLTLVPSLTFTAMPTIDPTTGIASGLIEWNSQPFAGVQVKLCTKWLYTCSGAVFTGVTDAHGKFTIAGISPGNYQLITKYPGQNDETRRQDYSNGGSPLAITITAGQETDLAPVAICKVDLVLYAPIINGHSVTFSWEAYPGATSYNYGVTGTNAGGWFLASTSFSATLPPGSYQCMIQTNGPCSQGIGNFKIP